MTNLRPSSNDPREFRADAAGRTEVVDMAHPDGDAGEAQPEDRDRPLFPAQQCDALEKEWQAIQANFVDSPRKSVEQADGLVTKTIDTLSGSFGEMRSSLERGWEKNGDVSTEELRLAMQNYRSFFRRLLSI